MRLGIIGLPQSGKTTIFNALTRGDRPVGPAHVSGGGRFEVQTAVVPVPDPRVDVLSRQFKPRKTIYAQVTYADIYPANRTDAEIIADQKKDAAMRNEIAHKNQEPFKKLDKELGKLGF